MSMNLNECSVFPRDMSKEFPDVEFELTKDEKREAKVNGSRPIILFLVFAISMTSMTGIIDSVLVGLIVSCAVTYGAYTFSVKQWMSNAIYEKDLAYRNEKYLAEEEAKKIASNYTKEIFSAQLSLGGILEILEGNVSIAESKVKLSEEEFEQGSYSPFWDAVEVAVSELNQYKDGVELLANTSKYCNYVLANNNHDFPELPLKREMIPDASNLEKRLAEVVRKAQSNFEFSSILEQRKTRGALVAGYNSISDAVVEISSTIDSSIQDLDSSLSAGFSSMVNEQRLSNEIAQQSAEELNKQSRKLNSIWRGDKTLSHEIKAFLS